MKEEADREEKERKQVYCSNSSYKYVLYFFISEIIIIICSLSVLQQLLSKNMNTKFILKVIKKMKKLEMS